MARFNQRLGTSFALDDAHLRELKTYTWPGNIRELENILERSVVLSEPGRLQLFLPDSMNLSKESAPLKNENSLLDSRQAAEKEVILKALEKCGGNKSQAAVELGVSRRTLLYKVKALAL